MSFLRVVDAQYHQYVRPRNRRHAHLVGAPVKRVGFRGRLFAILLAFALVPSILIAVAWNATGSFVLPLV
jgi:hypothetical protein